MSVDINTRAIKVMIYPAVWFLIVGMSLGVFISFNAFLIPDYFSGEYATFGRIRPMHVNHVALLWLLAADLGLIYFIVQKLAGVRIWSSKLANLTNALFWFSTIVGVYSLAWGTNSGWEYAELPFWVGPIPVKHLFTLAWVCFSVNIAMTLLHRKHEKMYVSLWYFMGALIWTTFTWLAGNYFVYGVPGGISRVNMNFFYVHNLVGLIFTPMGVGIAYYLIPKIARTPIYNHKLSMIGFWTIAFFYSWIGAHHIIHGPMAQWLQTISIIFSIWLFIPVWTVIVNFFMTMKAVWFEYTEKAEIRFLMMGTVFYFLTCIQGPLQSLRNVNEITSKTDWVIGHAHMALLGAFTYFSIAGVYHVVPIITNKPLWSRRFANWHFTVTIFGSMLFFIALWFGGYMQGLSWANWAVGSSYAEFHLNLTRYPFLASVADMKPWWTLRLIGGALMLLGNILFGINIFNTIMLKPKEQG